jgi:Cellulase (glycosyl hydrolase family 5)
VLAGVAAFLVNTYEGDAASTLNFPVPNSFFGMTLIDYANWPTVPIGALGKGTMTNWEYVEPSRGVYNWSNLDAWVASATQHGVDFFYSNDGVPEWAVADRSTCQPSYPGSRHLNCPSMPENIQDWDDFYTALVKRYKGKIKYYELWNEPYQQHDITIPDLVTLTTHAYDIIRSADPNAQIISPSMAGNHVRYAREYFAAGGPTGVDIASLHAYPDASNPSADYPENVNLGNRLYPKSLQSVISRYLPGKPLWDTEGSWNQTRLGNFTTFDQQAAFVARWYVLHWSSGISRNYWYAWDNSELGTLMPSLLGSNIPAIAFQQIQNWMVGATMSTPCDLGSDGLVWTCGLTQPGKYQALIIWNTQGAASYTPPGEYVRYRNLDGSSVPITGPITIGISPVILEY